MPQSPAHFPANLADDYRHCLDLARRHYENFPVASVLVPKAVRPHIAAVYAFARQADDFADEPEYQGRREALLDDWEARLRRCAEGQADDPVFRALGHTLAAFELPLSPFLDLLSAFRQDLRVKRYADDAQLMDYCRRSANPVGRIVLMLFGYRDAERLAWSDAICSGLQLANFWQDISVDRRKGRIYIPRQELDRFTVSEAAILAAESDPAHDAAMRQTVAFQVARTRDLFQQGRPLCSAVKGRLSVELKATWLGGMAILDAIERAGFDTLHKRPAHRRADWLRLLAGALVPGRFKRLYTAVPPHA